MLGFWLVGFWDFGLLLLRTDGLVVAVLWWLVFVDFGDWLCMWWLLVILLLLLV